MEQTWVATDAADVISGERVQQKSLFINGKPKKRETSKWIIKDNKWTKVKELPNDKKSLFKNEEKK